MPRALDPASLPRGGGLAAQKSVEASSFVHPTQGLDGLIAHVVDPRGAHQAQAISVADTAGLFASDDVEGALAEIAGTAGATGQNGVIQGGTHVAVGLNVTLATPTLVAVGGTQRDLGGEAIALTAASTNWLYVHGTTGALSVLVGGAPPSITSPEHVLLSRLVTDGVGVTATTDARWFVKNLDRKLPLTVRASGTEADRNSEASFESLDAAMLYLANFGPSGVMRTYTVVIKGEVTVPSVITVPVDGVTFQGDDGCVLVTGASLNPMFDISGRTGVTFQDITFTAAHAASTAIGVTGSGAIAGITVSRCLFSGTGGQQWVSAFDVAVAGPQARVVVADTRLTATVHGIRLREPQLCDFRNLVVVESGGAGTAGLSLGWAGGGINTAAGIQLRAVDINGFGVGAYLRAARIDMSGCTLLNSDTGVQLDAGSTNAAFTDGIVSLDSTNGLIGFLLDGDGIVVRGVTIANTRPDVAYAAQVPVGIDVLTGVDAVTIAECRISGFFNSVTPGGHGIRFQGTSAQSVVQATTITGTDTSLEVLGACPQFRVLGCTLSNTRVGLGVQSDSIVSDTTINLSSTRGMTGVSATGANVRITACRIFNTRAAASYLIADAPTGILLNTTTRTVITGTEISGFYNQTAGNLGACIGTAAPSSNVTVEGCMLETGYRGIDFTSVTGTTVTSTTILNTVIGVHFGSQYNSMTGCSVTPSTSIGVTAVSVLGADTAIANCTLINTRAGYAGEDPSGVSIGATNVKVTGCRITNWRNAGGSLGSGVRCLTGTSQATIVGNTITTCWNGVLSDNAAGSTTLVITDNVITGCDVAAVSLTNSDQVAVSNNTITLVAVATTGILVSTGTDIEVIGNRILGNSAADFGIRLVGTNTAANRLRRFVVSGNNVRAIRTAGIRLDGYVQNGVVSNNHVDGALAAGDPSAVAGISIISSTTDLAKYVSVTGNVVWRARNGIAAAGVSYLNLLTNLTISGNTIHHCALGTAGVSSCAGVDLTWVKDSDVSGNTIYQIGQLISDGDVVSNPAAGADVYPTGVRLQNVVSVSVTNNEVSNLVAVGAGESRGIHLFAAGNAAPNPVLARTIAINGNRLVMDDGSTGFTYGIAIGFGQNLNPGDTSSIYGLSIASNTIRNMSGPGVYINVGGGCTLEQASITGNDISVLTNPVGTAGVGIQLLAVGSTDFADGIIREVDISDNNIGDAAERGVYVGVETGCTMTGVTVRNNTISTCTDRGIHVDVSQAPTAFANLSILDNNVLGATQDAIVFSIRDFAPSNIAINGNTITSATGGYSAAKGIVVRTSETAVILNSITGLSICDNTIVSTGEAIDVLVEGLLTDAAFSRNTTRINSNVAPISIVADTDTVVAGEAYSRNVIIDGNTIRDGYESLVRVGSGQKLANFAFTGNKVYSSGRHGFRLEVDAATVGANDSVINADISRNAFDEVQEQAVRILLGTTGVINACTNITVKDNQFDLCNQTGTDNGTIYFAAHAITRNVAVEGNSFTTCGTFDGLSGVVSVLLGHTGLFTSAENISLSRNTFMECSGPAIYVTDNTAAAKWSLANLRVDGNTVSDHVYSAIYLDVTAFTTATQVSVSGNQIGSVSGASNDNGIQLQASNPMTMVSVCQNVVRDVDGSGITLNFAGIVSAAVSDNTVSDAGLHALHITNNVGNLRNLVVADNQLRNWGQIGGVQRGGLYLVSSQDVFSTSVTGNVVSVNTETLTTGYWFDIVDIDTLVFGDNTAYMNNVALTNSMIFDVNAGTVQVGLAIVGNTFRGAATGVDYSGAAFAPEYSQCSHNVERTTDGTTGGNWGTALSAGSFCEFFVNSITASNQD